MPLEVTVANSTGYTENWLVGLSCRSHLILAVLFTGATYLWKIRANIRWILAAGHIVLYIAYNVV